ncbi:hypothetical protein NDU88_002036 [Pleurodeles waltl]|uniref:Uncharacterized protein n=1 Tax=Pleurodeles waltl TaxID=8319 RepID=A0AAV7KSG2_PLEWA|nr:hypothetical protein NDU88_002036 [Pleurodeles waltl]
MPRLPDRNKDGAVMNSRHLFPTRHTFRASFTGQPCDAGVWTGRLAASAGPRGCGLWLPFGINKVTGAEMAVSDEALLASLQACR